MIYDMPPVLVAAVIILMNILLFYQSYQCSDYLLSTN